MATDALTNSISIWQDCITALTIIIIIITIHLVLLPFITIILFVIGRVVTIFLFFDSLMWFLNRFTDYAAYTGIFCAYFVIWFVVYRIKTSFHILIIVTINVVQLRFTIVVIIFVTKMFHMIDLAAKSVPYIRHQRGQVTWGSSGTAGEYILQLLCRLIRRTLHN